MGMVLSFSARSLSASHKARPTGQPASVIIFPGVRYERIAEADTAASQTAKLPAPKKPTGKARH